MSETGFLLLSTDGITKLAATLVTSNPIRAIVARNVKNKSNYTLMMSDNEEKQLFYNLLSFLVSLDYVFGEPTSDLFCSNLRNEI